ncbi:hypothetical protein [Bradyrhizobium vignae]|uniref:hypothetical protein n=1 Tax=Bradyrhizobium vignae TaxID=1549949 RepID=UPI001ABFC30A
MVFTTTITGALYARHVTTTETRLTVIDKVLTDDPRAFPQSPGMAPDVDVKSANTLHLACQSPRLARIPYPEQSFRGGRRQVMSLVQSSCTKAT